MRKGCQQAADLTGGQGDEADYVVAAMLIMPQAYPGSCPQPLVPLGSIWTCHHRKPIA